MSGYPSLAQIIATSSDACENPRFLSQLATSEGIRPWHLGGVHTTEMGTHYVVMESPMLAMPGHPG
jgi:hypothetical protein